MVEVMKIMATSFEKSHAGTATLNAPDPAAGHSRPKPLPETPEHSWASLGQSLWSHYSFLLGPGAYKVLFVPSKSLSPLLCKFWQLMVRLMMTSSKRAYAIPWSTAARATAPVAVHC